MSYKRIIPTFLLNGDRLVKGTQFKDYIDVGDPISQAKIYDAQGADEIILTDISATKCKKKIDTSLITKLTSVCHTPIAVGGGIDSTEKAALYFESGADKIVVNTGSIEDPSLIKELSKNYGSQSIVVSIDVRRDKIGKYQIYSHSGEQEVQTDIKSYLDQVIDNGCGEIMLTSIDADGTLHGYDYELYNKYASTVSVPLIASGGAGCYDDIVRVLSIKGVDACGIGKMLFLRDYDIVRIKAYLKGKKIATRDA